MFSDWLIDSVISTYFTNLTHTPNTYPASSSSSSSGHTKKGLVRDIIASNEQAPALISQEEQHGRQISNISATTITNLTPFQIAYTRPPYSTLGLWTWLSAQSNDGPGASYVTGPGPCLKFSHGRLFSRGRKLWSDPSLWLYAHTIFTCTCLFAFL